MTRAAMDTPLSLLDRLRCCAQLWCEANDATFARLGREVINDGGFFTRIEQPGAGATTATLERFARFFADAGNWPPAPGEGEGGAVPEAVAAFVHVTGVSPALAAAATGQIGDLSGRPAEKAA